MTQFYTGMTTGGFIGIILGLAGALLALSLCNTAGRESVYCREDDTFERVSDEILEQRTKRRRKRYFEIAPTQPDPDPDCVDDDFVVKNGQVVKARWPRR